eukprot:TRINITY_DN87397_c0_g1_i1.p1 TRINITY_DN87397_c0_g1~~TRINITY_DN87397_c0_g1_i1.p1  ORF type:complete len:124 (+),score=25.18 TRINITY_DN87397_c0_g1_i1:132-503(+)
MSSMSVFRFVIALLFLMAEMSSAVRTDHDLMDFREVGAPASKAQVDDAPEAEELAAHDVPASNHPIPMFWFGADGPGWKQVGDAWSCLGDDLCCTCEMPWGGCTTCNYCPGEKEAEEQEACSK